MNCGISEKWLAWSGGSGMGGECIRLDYLYMGCLLMFTRVSIVADESVSNDTYRSLGVFLFNLAGTSVYRTFRGRASLPLP